jgi:transposase
MRRNRRWLNRRALACGAIGARRIYASGLLIGWISELLAELGHEVLVANPRNVRSISTGTRKNDRMDARQLGRLARVDPQLLSPIRHRGRQARHDLILIRAREELVKTRTLLVNLLIACTKRRS